MITKMLLFPVRVIAAITSGIMYLCILGIPIYFIVLLIDWLDG